MKMLSTARRVEYADSIFAVRVWSTLWQLMGRELASRCGCWMDLVHGQAGRREYGASVTQGEWQGEPAGKGMQVNLCIYSKVEDRGSQLLLTSINQ